MISASAYFVEETARVISTARGWSPGESRRNFRKKPPKRTWSEIPFGGMVFKELEVELVADKDNSKLLATASVTVADAVRLKGIRVVASNKGTFVTMPSRKDPTTDVRVYQFSILGRENQMTLERMIMDRFNQLMKGAA